MIEIYNPNPWMTFGGMGSKKLAGRNIEYIANNDSHPGAQFDPEFRNLVKREIAKFTAEDRFETAQAETHRALNIAQLTSPTRREGEVQRPNHQQKNPAADDRQQITQAGMPKSSEPPKLERVAVEQSKQKRNETTAFLERLSSSVNSGYLFAQPRLTIVGMEDFVRRTYHGSALAHLTTAASD